MGAIGLRDVTKNFGGGGANAVDGVSIEIEDGEFLVLVGPSGCGKSTLLRMIAGIEDVSDGEVVIDGDNATYLPPKERDIAMVFQSYALYPHMTVAENLEFGLKLRRVPKAERRARVGEVVKMLRLEALEKRRPAQLSGGQRQRVAMGRAMVREPAAFLMDEPLSNLDAKLRVAMRAELARLHDRVGITTIYVTHDQIEAMTLGDRVAVLRDGVLQQIDSPQDLYHNPRNVFVAAFIGSPTINLVRATSTGSGFAFADHLLPVPSHLKLDADKEVVLGIRPSDFEFGVEADAALPRMTASVEVVENLGPEMHVVFAVDAPRVDVEGARESDGVEGADDRLLADARSLFTAALPARRAVEVGERIELAVDIGRIHLFDTETGDALGLGAPSSVGSAPVGNGLAL